MMVRLLAVAIALFPLVLLESGLRLFGVARSSFADPLSGFSQSVPLFERQGAIYRTSAGREPFFCHQEFPAEKPRNGFRIFCLGGSTVHGHPYQSETAFPKW